MTELYQRKFGLKFYYLRWVNIFRALNCVVQNKTNKKPTNCTKKNQIISCQVSFIERS